MNSWRQSPHFLLLIYWILISSCTANAKNFLIPSRFVPSFKKPHHAPPSEISVVDSQPESQSTNTTNLLNTYISSFQQDLKSLTNLPPTTLTTPCHLILRDRTYTLPWTLTHWSRHQAPSLQRYWHHISNWIHSTTAASIVPVVAVELLWAVCVSLAAGWIPRVELGITKFTVTMTFLQSPVLLLLTLRTNRALDRLLEARRAWGSLNSNIRSLMGLVCNYILPEDPRGAIVIARYLVVFSWTLKAVLRGEEDDALVEAMFSSEEELRREYSWLKQCEGKRPIAILTRLRYLLARYSHSQPIVKDEKENGVVSTVALLRMEETLHAMEQAVGICNRIQISPIPPTYTW